MQVSMTINEAMLKYDWKKLCEVKGMNPWILNEGLATGDEKITLTEEEMELCK
jgi:hypothetical protein